MLSISFLQLLVALSCVLIGSPLVQAASQLTPPSGAIVVAKTGSADSTTIQGAIKKAKAGSTIFIRAGSYQEQVTIESGLTDLTIIGETPDDSNYKSNRVTVFNSLTLDQAGSDPATATLGIFATGVKVIGLTVQNTASGDPIALAVSSSADRQGFYGCKFESYHDTFLGDKGSRLVAGSAILGSTDFIFGRGKTAIINSDISINLKQINGKWNPSYVTAPGYFEKGDGAAILLDKCTISKASGSVAPDGQGYLGRPWMAGARAIVQNSKLGSIINAAGWSAWNPDDPHTDGTVFQEYGNTGAGAAGTRKYETALSAPVTLESIIGSDYKEWALTRYI